MAQGLKPAGHRTGFYPHRTDASWRQKQMTKDIVKVGRRLIYGIIDPRSACLFYIGKTHKRRENRLEEHIRDSLAGSKYPVHVYIADVISCGFVPTIFVIERLDASADWQEAERRWIAHFRELANEKLPYLLLPQTPKSTAVLVKMINIMNVRRGG